MVKKVVVQSNYKLRSRTVGAIKKRESFADIVKERCVTKMVFRLAVRHARFVREGKATGHRLPIGQRGRVHRAAVRVLTKWCGWLRGDYVRTMGYLLREPNQPRIGIPPSMRKQLKWSR